MLTPPSRGNDTAKSIRNASTGKPSKPYVDFPLFPHATRRWAKKIRGELHYFGPWTNDPDRGAAAAPARYREQAGDLHAGRTPRAAGDGLRVRELCNRFLASKSHLLDTGEIAPRTFQEYHNVCKRGIDAFGKTRLVEDLAADDFERLRATMAKARRAQSGGPEASVFAVALKQEVWMITVAEKWAEVLGRIGIRYVFGIPSGPWVEYMEALRASDVEFVLVSNEASAGFMADVCARITGIPGACYGTFGPGATNLSTGVGGALLDRSPLLAFTHEMSGSMLGRTTQMGIDHQALFRPITKWTTRLEADHVQETLLRAVHVATTEVPGPVHIGLPSDLGTAAAADEEFQLEPPHRPDPPDPDALDRLVAAFTAARRPLLAVGLSAVRAGVQALVLRIADQQGIPVVLTPMAKGMVPESHPSYAGVLFHALSNHVAETHRQADLVIGVGYDPVELNYEDWMPDAPLIHIDSKGADLDRGRYRLECDVVGSLRPTLERLAGLPPQENDWDPGALAERRRRMFERLRPREGTFGPTAALTILREMLSDDGILTADVGAHLHVIGQLWRTPAPGSLLMTNGWSSMGFGIPAAIAAKLCLPDRPVACVVGDGGFLMMVGEMATAKRLGVPVVFVLLTDHSLTLIGVKQQRESYPAYGTPLHGDGYDSAHTFFGVPVLEARDAASYREALGEAFAAGGPVIVEAFIDPREYNELVLKGNR